MYYCASFHRFRYITLKMFDLERVGQDQLVKGHRVQLSKRCHSMVNIKLYDRHF